MGGPRPFSRVNERVASAGACRLDGFLADAFGAGEGVLGHVGNGQAQHLVFEQHAHFEHLRQFRIGHPRDHRPAIALEHHQAFGLQAL